MNSKYKKNFCPSRYAGVFIAMFVICIVILLFTLPVFGHRLVPLSPADGKLHNLPAEFNPAAFDLKTATLSIAGKDLVFPEAISKLLPKELNAGSENNEVLDNDPLQSELLFTASWRHGPSLIPPYIQMRIRPKNENFIVTVIVDLERMVIMESHVAITSSTNQTISFPMDLSESEPAVPDDWRIIVGLWRNGDVIVRITEDRIDATMGESVLDYPKGEIEPVRPGKVKLTTPSGKTEVFLYAIKDDVLRLTFERAPNVPLARLGSEADRLARERLEAEIRGQED